MHIGNDYKVLNGLQQYPWQEMQGRTPLSPAEMAPFRSRLRIGRWNGSGGLYGTRAQVREARRLLRRALKGMVSSCSSSTTAGSGWRSGSRGRIGWSRGGICRRTLELLRPVYGLMRGVPTEQRSRAPTGASARRRRCRWIRTGTAAGCCGARRSRRWKAATRSAIAAISVECCSRTGSSR